MLTTCRYFCRTLALGAFIFPALAAAQSSDPFIRAALDAERAAAAFRAADRAERAWAGKADPCTGLLPQNLRSPIWTPANSAADLYPFFVLSSRFTHPEAYEGRWLKVLFTETQLTSRLGALPDDYSLERGGFAHDQPDLHRIIFGSSEYVKDGLIPITDLLGVTPWFYRMREIVDGLLKAAPVSSRFGSLPADSAEVNGNMLQSLSRLHWATADPSYLEAGERILRAWFEEVLPASGGLPVHRWDFGAHKPIADTLSLNDHGNEIVGGLAEFYLTLHFARPEKASALRPAFIRMIDRLLEIGRNDDGLWFSLLRPATGEALNRRTPDTWGYALTAVTMAHLITGKEAYREAVRRALASLKKPEYLDWSGADAYADSIEGGILLANREPVPEALEWLDRIFPRFLAYQQPDGMVEGWHGDGNFARTALLYALMKTRGASLQPWREDLRLGAVQEGDKLYLSVKAGSSWEGLLQFDRARHRDHWHLPINYPRLNEFPVWFAARPAAVYRIKLTRLPKEAKPEDGRRAPGLELQHGLPLKLEASEELRIEVEEEPAAATPVGRAEIPMLDRNGLLLEAESFAGPWRLQTNYPDYSGKGFRVSNASGIAPAPLLQTLRVAAAGEYAVWARGLASKAGDRAFSVQVGGKKFPPTHGAGEETGFVWERCGAAALEPGEVEVAIRDEGAGFECPDALFFTLDAAAKPPVQLLDQNFPGSATARALDKTNLARLIELHDQDDARRRARLGAVKDWGAWRRDLSASIRKALGLDPELPRTPLNVQMAGIIERPGYRVEKFIFESRPGLPVPANLYLPSGEKAPRPPWPAVLCPVGHWPFSKAEPVVQARAAGFARLGLAALAYDPIGQGERITSGNEHSQAHLAALLNQSNMSIMIWDSIRALDVLEARPEIDKARLGATGCSGGGLNTLYLMAVEPRLQAAAPVCYVCTFASFLKTGLVHCPCSHVPGMGSLTDMDEAAALFAPRPALVIGGVKDPMFTEAGTKAAFEGLSQLYRLQGAAPAPELFFDDCGHDYSRPMRERAYGFFLRHLAGRGTGEAFPEPMAGEGWQPEKPEALFCFPEGKYPAGALTYRQSILQRLAAGAGKPAEALRAAIRGLVPAARFDSWKSEPVEGWSGAAVLTDEEGFKHRILTAAVENAPAAILVLDDAGWATGTPALLELLSRESGFEALAIEPPFWSAAGDEAWLAVTDGLLLGRPPAVLWARTVLGHARKIRASGRRVLLFARGPAASLTALIALLGDGETCEALGASQAPSSWADLAAPWINRPGAILPGGGDAGDVADLLRAAAPRRVLWAGTPLRSRLPLGIEVREEELSPTEAARWLRQ